MKKYLIPFITLCIIFSYCANPEKKFQNAERLRSMEAFEKFVKDFPNSELVEKAKNRIAELEFWAEIDSSLAFEPYQTYIDSFASGLFISEAQDRLKEIQDFKRVSELDMIGDYKLFSERHPGTIFNDSLSKRIACLKPAEEKYLATKSVTSTMPLKDYLKEFKDTGYGKLIQIRLDSLALEESVSSVLNQSDYNYLPKSFNSLQSKIEKNEIKEPQKLLLAKQAMEDIIINSIKIAGPGNRFILPQKVMPRTRNFRYTIKEIKQPTATIYEGKGESGVWGWNSTIKGEAEKAIICTEYPDDLIPLLASNFSGLTVGTGSISDYAWKNLEKVPFTNGTVWRFSGRISLIPNYTILGDPKDPISFYLTSDYGAIHIHGKGEVRDKNGNVIFSTKGLDVLSHK